jgi:thiol-disulfide isomerase/thioredoxin
MSTGSARGEDPKWKWYEVKERKVQLHLHVFWSSTCPHCAKAHKFLDALKKKHEWLKVFSYEVSGTPENMDLYRKMAESIDQKAGQVPAFFYCKRLEIGYASDETTGAKLEKALIGCRDGLQKQVDDRPPPKKKPAGRFLPLLLIAEQEGETEPELELDVEKALPPDEPMVEVPWWGTVKAHEVPLPTLTLVLGGLDAFNPCAFFVLMILLSLMLHTGSRSKMLLVGGIFVFISGLVYFLFMAAWLNLFFLVGHLRIITLAAGVVAVVAASINIKDYFWFKQGISLSLTQSARYRLIGRMASLKGRSSLVSLITGTAALAFAANLYELLCTSGFPLVYTRVLTLRELNAAEYYGYLALYNLIYVTPLFLIVVAFSLTLSAHKLTEYQGRILKLVSGLMMLALGIILVVSPAFLNDLIGAGLTLAAAIAGTTVVAVLHRAIVGAKPAAPIIAANTVARSLSEND